MRCRPAQVVVLAKSPVAGHVKTRLSPPYLPHQAAELALAALLDTLHAATHAEVERCVLVLDGKPGSWLPDGIEVRPQSGGPLDERISHAFADTYARLPLPVLLVGMDTPQVTAADLDRAVQHLLRPGTDAVLGPAEDGGYWAIGLREPRPEHVLGVPMSRADTGAAQLDRLHASGLQVQLLESRRDVDDASDALAVAQCAPGGRFAHAMRRLAEGAA